VERGDKLVWCAGALARDYGQIGGQTKIAGKPHSQIYEAALKAAEDVAGHPLERKKILAIGDGMMTDVKGAQQNGFDVLYISGGIHAREYGDTMNPDMEALAGFLEKHASAPVAWMPRLK
jgi:ribonucleotide monophosphatase NagD (HAD superfamily)